MNIKPMLLRLESAMGRSDLVDTMVLVPEPKAPISKAGKSQKSFNFIVGYNSSPKSQTALDITLCIAHQTRLATSKEVTVQVVYVIEENPSNDCEKTCNSTPLSKASIRRKRSHFQEAATLKCAKPVMLPISEVESAIPKTGNELEPSHLQTIFCQNHQFEQADRLLWQARCLADEWKGLFKAHLRFGQAGKELRTIVEDEAATLLVVGCSSTKHPLVRDFGSNFPCPVLGIPAALSVPERLDIGNSSSKLKLGAAMMGSSSYH